MTGAKVPARSLETSILTSPAASVSTVLGGGMFRKTRPNRCPATGGQPDTVDAALLPPSMVDIAAGQIAHLACRPPDRRVKPPGAASGRLGVMAVVAVSSQAARLLSEELLAGDPTRRKHVQGVVAVAQELAYDLTPAERDLVVAAAWLHDIGYAPKLFDTGMHALDGALHVTRLSLPAELVGLVAFHTGAVVEAEERGLHEVLAKFAAPPTNLLDRLTVADLSVGPEGQRVAPAERIEEILDRYDQHDPVHRAVTRSRADLLGAVERVTGTPGGQPM